MCHSTVLTVAQDRPALSRKTRRPRSLAPNCDAQEPHDDQFHDVLLVLRDATNSARGTLFRASISGEQRVSKPTTLRTLYDDQVGVTISSWKRHSGQARAVEDQVATLVYLINNPLKDETPAGTQLAAFLSPQRIPLIATHPFACRFPQEMCHLPNGHVEADIDHAEVSIALDRGEPKVPVSLMDAN